MPDYGTFNEVAAGHSCEFYQIRDVRIDFRGTVRISSSTDWGRHIVVLTLSHDPADWGKMVDRPVIVEANAKIMSCSLLYNCRIGEGAIVSAGSVVKSVDVPPRMVVDGNPAKIVGYTQPSGRIAYLSIPIPLQPGKRRVRH